ncbi:U1 small nuclear ribonucleoprotein 70 kDa [Hondaea fermentalgiana]|uniref:U1 small nuclear ribonucleoprotein 70 kDa n=1 Tax=Hondaea fermentalgiana TaxID=2315210 RepID=A0A2R5G897_9STRA|nr:U1 small nuclear ribonucleoprotein 70 kDa [Hondaea fermentalgiana]|eukprot:GBG23914.1 U1 small nuclear ribonucleoprotein 70 kDa [Hondaea fermentalgiana]
MRGYSRRNVAKGASGPPTMHLPQHVYALFQEKPLEKSTEESGLPPRDPKVLAEHPITGVAKLLDRFEDFDRKRPPPHKATVILAESTLREEARAAKRRKVAEAKDVRRAEREATARKRAETWDPQADPEKKTGDAYNTLFVAHLRRKTTEDQVREHFEKFGEIAKVVLVPKMGYAFVEFAQEDAFKKAYQGASKMLNGKRIIIDIERGRTVKDWKPQFLGGGVSSSRTTPRGYGGGGGGRFGGSASRDGSRW